MSTEEDFDRGFAAGHNAAEMAEFRANFKEINGSQAVTAVSLRELLEEFRGLRNEIATDKAAAAAATEALAAETEQRREVLADTAAVDRSNAEAGDRRFTRGEQIIGSVIALAMLIIAVQSTTHVFG